MFNVHNSDGSSGRIVIQPKDSVDHTEIQDNIETNLSLITDWVDLHTPKQPNDKVAWLMGGGPSLGDAMEQGFIDAEMFINNPNHSVWACKHALPHFHDPRWADVDFNVVALDPRPITGYSTHKINRQSLYASAPKGTTFYLASMTHPSVTLWCVENGFKVVGWHAASDALRKFSTEKRKQIDKGFHETTSTGALSIGGGTSSILRAIGLAKEGFGIATFNLLGLDSSLRLTPEEEEWAKDPNSAWVNELDSVTGARLRLQISVGNNPATWSYGELVAQLQDVTGMFEHQKNLGVDIRVVGTDKGRSLIGQLYDTVLRK